MEIFRTVTLSLFSGLFASLITVLITRHFENKKSLLEYKKRVFQDLIAFRADLVDFAECTGNFQIAINQVFVAYNDSQKVLEAFENFRKCNKMGVRTPEDNQRVIGALLTLLKLMAKEIHIDYSFSNDDLFTNPIIIAKKKS